MRAFVVFLVILMGCGGDGPTAPPPEPPAPPPPPPPDPPPPAARNTLTMSPDPFPEGEPGKPVNGRITFTATKGDEPLRYGQWKLETEDYTGWAYPSSGSTGQHGRFSIRWVPSFPGEGKFTVTVAGAGYNEEMEVKTVSKAPPVPPNTAMLFTMKHEPATGYRADVRPFAGPRGTFYAMNWHGGYMGLQRGGSLYDRQLQFSAWDVSEDRLAVVVEEGEGVDCSRFGHEGFGVQCSLEYPWSDREIYRYEMITRYEAETDLTHIMAYITDMATGQRRYIGTLGRPGRQHYDQVTVFLEDFARTEPHCLAQPVRAILLTRVRAMIDGEWSPLTLGEVLRQNADANNPDTPPCSNYVLISDPTFSDYILYNGLYLSMGAGQSSDPDARIVKPVP